MTGAMCAELWIARAGQSSTGDDVQSSGSSLEEAAVVHSSLDDNQPGSSSDIGFGRGAEEALLASIDAVGVVELPTTSNGSGESSKEEIPAASTAPPLMMPQVPWGLDTTLTVMALWLISFWLAAYTVVPSILGLLGVNARGQAASSAAYALRHLFLDATQLGATLLLLKRALREHAPRSLGLFAINIRPVRAWLPTVLAGCAAFPLVDWVHKQMVAVLAGGVDVVVAGGGAAGGGSGSVVAASGWEARALWFIVLAVCAPLWEEVMFRGFLLPSLAKCMPPAAAVAASSLVFALVHFTKEGFVPLLILGALFGAAYVRTLNLLPAIALHSLWNVCLLVQILATGGM